MSADETRKLIANLYAFHAFVTPGTHRLRFSSKREAKRFFRDIKRSIALLYANVGRYPENRRVTQRPLGDK